MTRERVEQWLDKQVEIYNLIKDNMYLRRNDGSLFCYEYANGRQNRLGISHLEEVAKIMGIPFKCEVFDYADSEFRTRLSFTYKGVEFYRLSDKEISYYEQTSTGVEVQTEDI
jgi:hypothetical protein